MDVSGYERVGSSYYGFLRLCVVQVFYLHWWGLRLVITTNLLMLDHLALSSEFFPGFSWPEREVSEMIGLSFLSKWDNRRLMTDYSFEGSPILKSFPTIGFEELEYDFFLRWLVHRSVKFQGGIEVFGH